MKNSLTLGLAAVALGVPALSHAGFVASTDSFAAANTSSINSVGNTLSTTTAGTLMSFLPDTAQDPQISGGDLSSYKFSLTATAMAGAGGLLNYSGTYRLFYDYAGGINVSTGTTSFTALQTSGRLDILFGSLVQTAGPANPQFADLGKTYGYNPISISGSFTQDATNSHAGLLQVNFDQRAQAVPEPASMGAMAIGALGLLRRRKKTA